MDTNPIDIETLERLAKAATPGPYEKVNGAYVGEFPAVGVKGPSLTILAFHAGENTAQKEADAAYIAAFSPSVVLALLTRLREAEKDTARVAKLESMFEFHWSQGYEEGDPGQLQKVEGSINDREYRLVGKGDTLREAIDSMPDAANPEAGR